MLCFTPHPHLNMSPFIVLRTSLSTHQLSAVVLILLCSVYKDYYIATTTTTTTTNCATHVSNEISWMHVFVDFVVVESHGKSSNVLCLKNHKKTQHVFVILYILAFGVCGEIPRILYGISIWARDKRLPFHDIHPEIQPTVSTLFSLMASFLYAKLHTNTHGACFGNIGYTHAWTEHQGPYIHMNSIGAGKKIRKSIAAMERGCSFRWRPTDIEHMCVSVVKSKREVVHKYGGGFNSNHKLEKRNDYGC